MQDITALHNKGVRVVGDAGRITGDGPKTLVVVGVARGGTSLVAGALHHLGVFVGDKAYAPVFEDIRLAGTLESGDMEDAGHILAEYGSRFPVWGFKRPGIVDSLPQWHSLWRNPVYLFVFKDIFSVANRNAISMREDLTYSLKIACDQNRKIVDFIAESGCDGVLYSYEKIMADRELFLRSLIDMLPGSTVDRERFDQAMRFIRPNPEDYLDASRVTKATGKITSFTAETLSGWAYALHSDEPVDVVLYVDDRPVASCKAMYFRPELADSPEHKTCHCGFFFHLAVYGISPGSRLRVRVEGEVADLAASPQMS